jgi:hypothetical protein
VGPAKSAVVVVKVIYDCFDQFDTLGLGKIRTRAEVLQPGIGKGSTATKKISALLA